MGRRGPAPKPTILKLAAGNPGKRPLNLREPVPPKGEPPKPDFLTEGAARIWDDLVPGLCRSGLARSIDGPVLARYCCLFEDWLAARAALRKGSTYPVKDGHGNVVSVREFPQAGQARRLNSQLLTMEREFGLTPASRTRIHAENDHTASVSVDELKRRMFAGA